MFVWLKRSTISQGFEGDMMLSFDPPEENEIDDWLMLTTRDRHYKEIAKELSKMAKSYDKTGDYKSKNICLDLADELLKHTNKPKQVN